MKRICAPGEVVRGIDIYHEDMISDINLLVSGGIKYAFLKATEGVSLEDSRFESRWLNMKRVGIIRGAYHFYHPSKDPYLQANIFLKELGTLEPADLPPVLDWESAEGTPTASDMNRAKVWLNRVQQATGRIPIVYGSPYFLQDLSLFSDFAVYPLWVAHYGVTCPSVPSPWGGWSFWQTSETGKVPGIQGACDKDVFNGSLLDLQNFIAKSIIKT